MTFHLPVMPEQAIIRSADSSKPTKARVDDTVHPKITVDFDYGETQHAVVRFLLPPQDEVGAFDSEARLDLRYVSTSALSGNVQFGVKYTLIDISDGQDKALSSEIASTISAYTGGSNTEYGVSFTFTDIFSVLDATKRYTLVLQITRMQPTSDLPANVSWISGIFMLNQYSSTAWDPTWVPLYEQDFSTLSDADILPGGDGNITIDGKTWYARNVAKMDSLNVGASHGGIKIGINTADTSQYDYYGAVRSAPALEIKLANLLDGTEFQERNDIEIRVTSNVLIPSGLSTTIYEEFGRGLRQDASTAVNLYRNYQGSIPGNAVGRRLIQDFSGSLVRGDASIDSTELAYTPNVVRIECLENYARALYSSSASASIGDDLVLAATYYQSLPYLKVGNIEDHYFYFSYAKSAGTPLATHYTLVGLRVEARFSPRGIGVRIP